MNPTPHQYHSRRRRIFLSTLAAGLVVLFGAALNQISPEPSSGRDHTASPPSHLEQVLGDAKEAASGIIENAKDAVTEAQPGLWHVTRAVDGDTIEVEQGGQKERVRMLGIDTPETHDPRKPVQCFGEAAAAHTKQLLEGKNVRLEPDPTNSDRDKYKRLLRYVYLPDGTLVNAALIRDGYAFAYTVFPLVKLDEFRNLEREARAGDRGLWAGCAVDESKQIKQTAGNK